MTTVGTVPPPHNLYPATNKARVIERNISATKLNSRLIDIYKTQPFNFLAIGTQEEIEDPDYRFTLVTGAQPEEVIRLETPRATARFPGRSFQIEAISRPIRGDKPAIIIAITPTP